MVPSHIACLVTINVAWYCIDLFNDVEKNIKGSASQLYKLVVEDSSYIQKLSGVPIFSPELKTEEGYSADIYLQRYMSAIYPSSVFSSGEKIGTTDFLNRRAIF